MRILYHHRTASRDGQSVHIDELIDAFRRRGHEIRIVGPADEGEIEFGDENRLISGLKKSLPGAVYELLELGYSLLTAIRLRRVFRQFKPDLFYERYNLFSPAGAWIHRRYGVPHLLEVNSPLAEEREKFGDLRLRRLARWSERYAWRNADRVMPVTQVLAEHIRAVGVPDARISIIKNGINRDRFDPGTDSSGRRRELGLEGALVLGFTGFVREWHGLSEVIRELPTLALLGNTPWRSATT